MISILNVLKNAECRDIFLQPTGGVCFLLDTFVLNFVKDGKNISLHTFSNVRVLKNNNIIYCVNDHYLDTKCNSWVKPKKRVSSITMKSLKYSIVGAIVKSVRLNQFGDIRIIFSNNLILEGIIDSSRIAKNQEIHRIILIDNKENNKPINNHYIVLKETDRFIEDDGKIRVHS